MEAEVNNNDQEWQKCQEEWRKSHRRGKVAGGIILVGVGALLLVRQAGVIFPEWLFTWKALLIVIGLFIGIKHNFRRPSWFILMLIGGAFIVGDYYPEMRIGHLFWPVIIIIAGLAMIFKPRRKPEYYRERWERKWRHKWETHRSYAGGNVHSTSEDRMETSAVFGSIKKNIIAKDFKGGEVNCVFGGAVIDLSQADMVDKAVLEVNCVFGGAKLIVPRHWKIQAGELVTVMGGIEDKRPPENAVNAVEKILILKGNAVFGGIEILN